MSYQKFIESKLRRHSANGFDADTGEYPLFDFQHAMTRWAARKGRCAIFADTGLGKTRMQLVWSDIIHRQAGADVLILAPLAVAEQTRIEGEKIGIQVTHARGREDVMPGINVTNYDRLHRFDPHRFGAIVLDESSIIKHHDAKTLRTLIDAFSHTDYRLCATATPAPNDWMELGTHAEFLGVCSRSEMLSEYFTHDGGETQKWRLKGHAHADFWAWVASWGAMIQSPSDLGFDDSAYNLPPLIINEVSVSSDAEPLFGQLFAKPASTLSERRQARRLSQRFRAQECADLINESSDTWVVWCELNSEGEALSRAIPDAVEIKGSDTIQHKEKSLIDFAAGKIRVLVTKPKIAGFGLNWQHCHNVAFIGAIDSFESYYQAIRRCWRFGQKSEVSVYMFVSDIEESVLKNLQRKEIAAKKMMATLKVESSASIRDEVLGQHHGHIEYRPEKQMELPMFMRRARAA